VAVRRSNMRYTGIALVMIAALFWGISGGISAFLMNQGHSPLVIAFYRGFISIPLFFVWALFYMKGTIRPSGRSLLWSFLAGFGVVGNFTFYMLSIEASSLPIAITLMYTAPVFVLLISLVVGIERSNVFKWASVALVVLGIALLTGAYDMDSSPTNLLGVSAGLLSGLSYTLFIFSFRNASRQMHTSIVLMFAFLAFSLIMFILMDANEAFEVLSSRVVGWFLLLGILGSGLSFTIYLFGLRRTVPSTAAVVAMVEPITASLIGLTVFGDRLSLIQFTGMAMILLTITHYSFKQAS